MRLIVDAVTEERTTGQQQWDWMPSLSGQRVTILVPGASSCCEGCTSSSCIW